MGRPLPSGMDRESSVDAPRREHGIWARRAFIAVVLVFVLLGLGNVFGQSTVTSEASSSAGDLRVTAPRALRGGLLYQVVIQVTARRPMPAAAVVMSPGWFSGLTTNAEVPQPASQTSQGGPATFSLGHLAAGDHKSLHIYFQVNPTTVGWRRGVDVELTNHGRTVVDVHRTITIYP